MNKSLKIKDLSQYLATEAFLFQAKLEKH